MQEALGRDRRPAESFQHQVLGDAERRRDPGAQAVIRDVSHAAPDGFQRIAAPDLPSCHDDAPGGPASKTGDHLGELALPIAGDAGDPDDLARVDLQVDVVQRRRSELAIRADPTQLQGDLSLRLCRAFLLLGEDHFPPDHHSRQLACVRVPGHHSPDHLSAPEDRDTIRNRHDLFELVRDKDDGALLGGYQSQGLEELLGFLWRQL